MRGRWGTVGPDSRMKNWVTAHDGERGCTSRRYAGLLGTNQRRRRYPRE